VTWGQPPAPLSRDHCARQRCSCWRAAVTTFCPVVFLDDRLGQRQVNKPSSNGANSSEPDFAQPCACTSSPETTREHQHPLLIPRSLVRSQHGPSDARESESHSGRRPRAPERSRSPTSHEESQGRRPHSSVRERLTERYADPLPRRMSSLGQHDVNNSIRRICSADAASFRSALPSEPSLSRSGRRWCPS
jgi:hypothetical protein